MSLLPARVRGRCGSRSSAKSWHEVVATRERRLGVEWLEDRRLLSVAAALLPWLGAAPMLSAAGPAGAVTGFVLIDATANVPLGMLEDGGARNRPAR